MAETKWLIAGLGNPGRKYEQTWHNSGYQVIDLLSQRHQAPVDRIRYRSLTATARIGGTSCLLLKPLTYMNLSGEAIREALRYNEIEADHCLVIYDDIDLRVSLQDLHAGLFERFGYQNAHLSSPRFRLGPQSQTHLEQAQHQACQ